MSSIKATAGEYDAVTATGKPEAENYAHESATPVDPRGGKLRVKGPALSQDELDILRQPLQFPFSGRTANNRFLKAPMTERLCQWNKEGEDISTRGFPTKEYELLYQRWGEGEIGVIVTGNIMLKYDAVEGYGNAILCDDHDNRVGAFQRVTAAAKKHGSLVVAQISHPGRQGNSILNPNPVSASDVQLQVQWMGTHFNKPRSLAVDEIRSMVADWGETAYLCHRAGFDGVQIHCAHGYLLAQFLSQTTNKRTDAYGGSLENRSRIVLEVIAEIRRRVPDPSFIICVKLNSVEFQPGGSTPDDCRDLCLRLQDEGCVDFVDLSGGTFEGRAFEHKKESTRARESYFIEFADMIRPLLTKTLVYVTGGFRTASGMADALRSGACHGVGIGRPLGAEPYLCRDLLLQHGSGVQGALESFVPLPQSTQATGTQLAQIGHGHAAVSDYSDEEEVRRWGEEFQREAERKEKVLPVVDSSGFPLFQAQSGFYYLR
ncbi:hypothetical protein PG993_004989 [Apiospora rasikravindrae]|uniref:NADH:flavin oxidoreductase/NADH oxidase N-terminal domain-containing protein n=1 Tax=Apiospora rasikravindrae TaxID=990691 RepID=A0ABR1TEA7_9PEZI